MVEGQAEKQRRAQWKAELARLREIDGEDVYAPIEDGVLYAVAGLSLLGFPTIASCEGHNDREWPEFPYVLMDFAKPDRFIRPDAPDQPSDRRERAYLAAVAWHINRSRREQLKTLLDEFYTLRGAPAGPCLTATADVYGFGITFRNLPSREGLSPRGIELLRAEMIQRCQGEMRNFGLFLHERWLSRGADGIDARWKGRGRRGIGKTLRLHIGEVAWRHDLAQIRSLTPAEIRELGDQKAIESGLCL
jgi:hypothetical protein